MSWYDTQHDGHEIQPPPWMQPRQRRSIVPLLFALVLVAAGGYIAWLLVSAPSTSPPEVTASISDDTVEPYATFVIGQQEQTGLLVIIADRLMSPTPTPVATRRPTTIPNTPPKNPYCQDGLSEGTQCRLPAWTPTARPPTPTIGPCYLLTPSQYSSPECLWVSTPTPDLAEWSD